MRIVDEVRANRPISVPIIDMHTHITPDNAVGLHHGIEENVQIVQLMDDLGINCMLTSPHMISVGEMALANETTARAIADFPGRIYGNISICPHDGAEVARKIVDEYVKKDGFVAMKMLTIYHGMPDQEAYAYALDVAQECGCPVTFHCWGDQIHEAVARVMDARPRLKVILAHQGGGKEKFTRLTAKMMKQYENLYVDTCGSLGNTLSVKDMVDLMGEDRIVFGTDILFLDPRFEIGRVVFSGITEAQMKKIFAENYLRLLEGSQLTKIRL